MQKDIKTIVFDLGGVLVDWNPAYVYNNVFNGDSEKVAWFLNTICTYDWNLEQDTGRTIREATDLKIAEYPEYEEWIHIYYNKWHEMFSGSIKANVDLLKALKDTGKYKLYALTNWSAETWPIALKLFPFFNSFDGAVVSGQERTRKPNPAIYNILMKRFSIDPQKTIFIDDNLENIVAADQLGFHTFHFQENGDFKSYLEKHNIIL